MLVRIWFFSSRSTIWFSLKHLSHQNSVVIIFLDCNKITSDLIITHLQSGNLRNREKELNGLWLILYWSFERLGIHDFFDISKCVKYTLLHNSVSSSPLLKRYSQLYLNVFFYFVSNSYLKWNQKMAPGSWETDRWSISFRAGCLWSACNHRQREYYERNHHKWYSRMTFLHFLL